ncbi:hypothetical protein GVI59_16680 [Acetobacter sicerae]|nr:hypothetical protein [Acetobacter sicerae]
MSKAFIAAVLQDSMDSTGVAATRAAEDLIEAIVTEIEKTGSFTLPSFGTFTVRETPARKALNPRTLEEVWVEAGRTVRFKASPVLKQRVTPAKPKTKATRGPAKKKAEPVTASVSTAKKANAPAKTLTARPAKAVEAPQGAPVKARRGRPKKQS